MSTTYNGSAWRRRIPFTKTYSKTEKIYPGNYSLVTSMCRVVLEINDKFLSQETYLKALKIKKIQDHLITEKIWGVSSPLAQ